MRLFSFGSLTYQIRQQKQFRYSRTLHVMAPPEIMFPREAGKYIAENSKHITIPKPGVQHMAQKILELLKKNPQDLRVDRWDLHVLNPTKKDQTAVDWVFVADVLNFSFWSDDESQKYAVNYKDQSWTGYWSLCAAMNRALDEGVPILDPKFYSNVTLDQLKHIFRSDTHVQMPMIEERLQHLHEAGKVLLEKYGGTFLNVVKTANKSAQKLLRTVVEDFPSFRDTAIFAGKKGHMFQSGDAEEVEIRGCSIWAVELIVEELKSLIAADPELPPDTHINAVILDHFLWDYRREHADEVRHIPIHKIRCVYY